MLFSCYKHCLFQDWDKHLWVNNYEQKQTLHYLLISEMGHGIMDIKCYNILKIIYKFLITYED